jgi:hypothetical protein
MPMMVLQPNTALWLAPNFEFGKDLSSGTRQASAQPRGRLQRRPPVPP